jgi:hypothetical protein
MPVFTTSGNSTGRPVFTCSAMLHSVTHDVAELLSGTGRDFQKTFLFDNPQQHGEMLRFQRCNGQMANRRKDVITHASEQAA